MRSLSLSMRRITLTVLSFNLISLLFLKKYKTNKILPNHPFLPLDFSFVV